MPIAFLLALQASGMIIDWLGKRDQIAMSRMGANLEQAGINANIATSRLESEDASVEAMKQLRMNMGTQIANAAARGVRSGQGNNVIASTESIGNFNADERMRTINQKAKEAQLKAGITLSKLHENAYEKGIWNDLRKSGIDKLSTTAMFAGGNSGSSAFAGSQARGSFGFTRIGG